jgi:hypothetical protein
VDFSFEQRNTGFEGLSAVRRKGRDYLLALSEGQHFVYLRAVRVVVISAATDRAVVDASRLASPSTAGGYSKPHEDAGMSAKRLNVRIMIRPVQAVVRQVKQAQSEHDARATREAVSHATTSLQ